MGNIYQCENKKNLYMCTKVGQKLHSGDNLRLTCSHCTTSYMSTLYPVFKCTNYMLEILKKTIEMEHQKGTF